MATYHYVKASEPNHKMLSEQIAASSMTIKDFERVYNVERTRDVSNAITACEFDVIFKSTLDASDKMMLDIFVDVCLGCVLNVRTDKQLIEHILKNSADLAQALKIISALDKKPCVYVLIKASEFEIIHSVLDELQTKNDIDASDRAILNAVLPTTKWG